MQSISGRRCVAATTATRPPAAPAITPPRFSRRWRGSIGALQNPCHLFSVRVSILLRPGAGSFRPHVLVDRFLRFDCESGTRPGLYSSARRAQMIGLEDPAKQVTGCHPCGGQNGGLVDLLLCTGTLAPCCFGVLDHSAQCPALVDGSWRSCSYMPSRGYKHRSSNYYHLIRRSRYRRHR